MTSTERGEFGEAGARRLRRGGIPTQAPWTSLLNHIRQAMWDYPRSFWLLFWGSLISAAGGSMVWPFLTIYIRERLDIPLTSVALLFTLNSAAGLVSTSFAGPLVDRFGRKAVMVLSLAAGSVIIFSMSLAGTLPAWMVLMTLNGAFGPLFSIGSNAIVADLIEPQRRTGAYALLRMSSNTGVAIGPAIGGFVTAVSYSLAFYAAAAVHIAYSLLILFFVAETVLRRDDADARATPSGYSPVLRDRPFMAFVGTLSVSMLGYVILMMLLPVYAKENFAVPEYQVGFFLATNAAMVVLFQYFVTRITRRYRHLTVLAVGSLFYAAGVGSVVLGHSFPAFLLSMVILTVGEMIVVPTAVALTADLAPADMRGRYMGLYGLTWSAAFGIGPVVAGYLNDHIAPVSMWYFGMVAGLAGTAGFIVLSRRLRWVAGTKGQVEIT